MPQSRFNGSGLDHVVVPVNEIWQSCGIEMHQPCKLCTIEISVALDISDTLQRLATSHTHLLKSWHTWVCKAGIIYSLVSLWFLHASGAHYHVTILGSFPPVAARPSQVVHMYCGKDV